MMLEAALPVALSRLLPTRASEPSRSAQLGSESEELPAMSTHLSVEDLTNEKLGVSVKEIGLALFPRNQVSNVSCT